MRIFALSALLAAALSADAGVAREQISIVGAAACLPILGAVGERLDAASTHPAPYIEETGSSGGLKLFCSGVGAESPDMACAARRIKAVEWARCNENGVTAIVESAVGFNGAFVANATTGAAVALTRLQVWTALAAEGPRPTLWSEVDPTLPPTRIEVLGPPPSSPTRKAFDDLVMWTGCQAAGKDRRYCRKGGSRIREDGAWVEVAEGDQTVVAALAANPNALGVLGFAGLQNGEGIKALSVDGVTPTFETVASGAYPAARSFYVYLKKAHVGVVPGLKEFLGEFTSNSASGGGGYLQSKGLIPLATGAHAGNRTAVMGLTEMSGQQAQQ